MSKIGLFYGTKSGRTVEASSLLKSELEGIGFEVDMHHIADSGPDRMMDYDRLILATPTVENGELPSDWSGAFARYSSLEFRGKKIAFLGLGDRRAYSENFLDAVGVLADPVRTGGGKIVGRWPAELYDFAASRAQEGQWFVGLALDDTNEEYLTPVRIKMWAEQLRREFEL